MSQEEIEDFYNACTGFFSAFFSKWKKEKLIERDKVNTNPKGDKI